MMYRGHSGLVHVQQAANTFLCVISSPALLRAAQAVIVFQYGVFAGISKIKLVPYLLTLLSPHELGYQARHTYALAGLDYGTWPSVVMCIVSLIPAAITLVSRS